MITPRPTANKCGSSYFIDNNTPRVLMRCTLSQSSMDCSCNGAANPRAVGMFFLDKLAELDSSLFCDYCQHSTFL
jgi:hypothetical protein